MQSLMRLPKCFRIETAAQQGQKLPTDGSIFPVALLSETHGSVGLRTKGLFSHIFGKKQQGTFGGTFQQSRESAARGLGERPQLPVDAAP